MFGTNVLTLANASLVRRYREEADVMVNRTHLFLLPQATRNPSPKLTDLSLQDVGLMAARHSQLGPNRPLRAQKGKRPQTAGLALRVPRPEEEDPRVSVEAGMGFEAGALPGVLRQARLPEDRGPDSVVHRDMGRKSPRLHTGTLRGSEHQPQGTIRSDRALCLSPVLMMFPPVLKLTPPIPLPLSFLPRDEE